MAAVALVFLLISAFTCNRFRGLRCYWMIATLLVSLIGILLMRQLPTEKKWGRLVGVWLVSVFGAGWPLSLSLVSSNFAGFTKKSTVTAILFIGYCVGNIAGPQLFKTNEAPKYLVRDLSLISVGLHLSAVIEALTVCVDCVCRYSGVFLHCRRGCHCSASVYGVGE